MKKKIFIIIFIIIFFNTGCTEMSREEKNLCYSLTTQSYDYIGNCKTEKECFEEIDELFETDLGYEQESKLYELKNNFGRSWFYYNKGIEELKKLSTLCSNGSTQNLPGAINQTRFYLEEAFREMDLGILNSFEIISLEEQVLTEQKIDYLKEEEIYYSLIELRQILSDLDSGNTKNKNYVSYYLNKIQKYNSSNMSKEYVYLIEKDSFWIKSYKFVEGAILTNLGLGKEGSFPFLSNYFYDMFTSLENVFFKEESLKELKKLPAKEFMKLYSDLAGKENSSIKRFSELLNKINTNYRKIINDIPEYWKKINELENKNSNLLYEINKNKNFDFLEKELLLQGISKKIDYELLLEEIQKEILELKEKKSKNLLNLGEELFNLKKINNNLIELNTNLEIKKQKDVLLLKEKCFEEAKKIKEEKYNISKKELELIKQDLLFFATNVIKKNEEILYYCEEMLKKKNYLIEGINNFEELEAKKMDLIKDCFEYLDKTIFYSKEHELILLFENLKKEKVTNENLFYFNDACESIKKQLNNILKEDYIIQKIIENIEKLIEEKITLEKINYYLNENTIKKEIEEIKKMIAELEKYYKNKKINYKNILPKKEQILEQLENELKKIVEKNKIYKIKVIEKLIEKEYLINELKTIETDINLILRININNPFEEIKNKETFFIEIEKGEIKEMQKNVENIQFGENGFIVLTNIPSGKTKIDIEINKKINLIEEDKIIYATNQSGLIQRKITVETEKINKLLIKTKQLNETTKIVVFIEDKEVNYSIQENEIIFVGENIDKKTNIIIFFYTKKLINLEKNLENSKLITLQNKKIEYNIIAKNLTNETIKGTLIIPINSNENIKQINVFDEIMTNKQKEILNNNIILKNQDFLPKQERKYTLILEIELVEEYYEEQLNDILNKLKQIKEEEITKKIEDILKIEFNEKLIKEYEKLIKEGNEKILEIENENIVFINEQIKIDKIKEKIKELQKNVIDAEKLGLNEIKSEMIKIIEKATNELENNKIDSAFLTIEKSTFEIDKEILKKISEIIKKTNKQNIDNSLATINEEIIEKAEEIEKIIAFDPISAKKTYLELLELYEEYNTKQEIIELEKKVELENKQKEFDELLKNTKLFIIFLEKQFLFDNLELSKLKFVYPITKSRLEKIKTIINDFEKYNEKDFLQLKNVKSELTLAIDEIKRFVIKEYNLSIDSGKSFSILNNAKKEIDSNNYIQALLILANESDQNFIILGIIPILLIIFVAGVLKLNILKRRKKSKELKQKVLEQWEE
ncbi:MAG: hypothetical protein PHP82_03200 [Candidatus ainarchaeum sp.]|nr:hypothetical protein [Candidatus ainarchaeum sp.]